MRIGWFLKQSFIDWDGKITAIIFTKGCNMRCYYCHNPSLVLPELLNKQPDILLETILHYLELRKSWLEGIVVSGGEPTIHNDLPALLQSIKQIGYPIKLDTNGTNPDMLKLLIENKLIDYVALDIKTILKPLYYEQITGIKTNSFVENIQKSLEILRNLKIPYQIRTTITEQHSTDIIKILKEQFKNENYKLQQFRNGEILQKWLS